MRITVVPGDDMACGRYRMRWPAEAAAAAGADVVVVRGQGWLAIPEGTDVLVLQRPFYEEPERMLADYRRRGYAVVVDVDDAFWTIDAHNPAFAIFRSRRHYLDRWTAGCDLVTTTTAALAARYRGRLGARVVPNCVPASVLELGRRTLERQRERPFVGWAGFVATHAGDLGVAASVMRELERFVVLGSPRERDRIAGELGVARERVHVFGPAPIDEYPQALTMFDVGLAPLRDTAFNRAKSALKMLEYAAAGAYPLGSPMPDNARVAAAGVGELVDGRRAWAAALRRLDGERLLEARRSAWQAAAAQTIERNVERWLDAWRSACG